MKKKYELKNGEKQSLSDSPPTRRKPVIPEALRALRERAAAQVAPIIDQEEFQVLEHLLPLILPSIVEIPPRSEHGIPKQVLREPLMMVSWDRAFGRWKWSIVDRTFEVQTVGHVKTLLGLIEAANAQIGRGEINVKDLEIKSDDGKWRD